LPSGPNANTLIADCDPPSKPIVSGFASMRTESARSDGPLTGGGST
jgi:hypothetical protein